MSQFLQQYQAHVQERAEQGVAPLALSAEQTAELIELIKNPGSENVDELMTLFTQRIPAGVDDATYVKASFLSAVLSGEAKASFLSAVLSGEASSPLIDKKKAVQILGTMQGGYNIEPLINALKDDDVAAEAVKAPQRRRRGCRSRQSPVSHLADV